MNKWFPNVRRRPGARFRLFCFPFAGGGASAFRGWHEQLPPWIEVWPLEYPGHESRFREAAFDDALSLAAAISNELAAVIDMPFALFGHSMGALLAFETARALRRLGGMQPVNLFVSGHGAPQLPPFLPPVSTLPEAEFREELRLYGGTPKEVLADDDLMQFLSVMLRRDLGICENYKYSEEPKLDLPIISFCGTDDRAVPWHRLLEWSHQSSAGFCGHLLEGEHFFIRKAAPLVCKMIADQLEGVTSLGRITPPAVEEIHLWRIDLELPEERVARLRQLLSPDELQRADAFLQPADRNRYSVTRAALRTLLGLYARAPAGNIAFTYSPMRKPRCEQLLPIDFNVAHSGSLALIAVSRGQAVGVDLELIRTGIETQEIARQVFTQAEQNELALRKPARRTSAFFDLWVRKEAFLKCRGEGLMGSPEKIYVGLPSTPASASAMIARSDVGASNRLVQSFAPAPNYAAALAGEKSFHTITFRDWPIDGD